MTTILPNTKTVLEKLCCGFYDTNLPNPGYYPPGKPRFLRKYLENPEGMTKNQLREGEKQKAEWEADVAAYHVKKTAYDSAERNALRAFRRDLETENGLDGHPKAQSVWDAYLRVSENCMTTDAVENYPILANLVK